MFDWKVMVVTLCVLVCCEALNKTDPGVCEKDIRVTRFVTRRTYDKRICRGKRLPCQYRKVEYRIERRVECCSGWQYNAINKTCYPLCIPDCINGTCVAPNKCHCEPPLRLVQNTCEQPVCEPHCGANSTCTDTNTCTCLDGFVSINSTHCGPRCPTGYFNDPLECKPKCTNKCTNGTCTAPDTCTCNTGYTNMNNHTCIPKCDTPCVNGACIEPNVCSCFEGYAAENEWKCNPVCLNCTNGECTAPGNCECHKGYAKKDGVRQPVCQKPCSNGMCAEPDKCQCNVGHELDPHDKFNCLPICEPKCVNASCVSPNKCSCLTGYEMAGNNWTCKPTCDECDNGDCVGPNDCRCHEGYEQVHGKCRPKCSRYCVNGVCTAPEVCSCAEGHKLSSKDKYTCEPVCEPACVNSTCVAPGKCQCLPKYESTKFNHICRPQCKTCVNGDCVAPDVCKCHRGYDMQAGICSPICQLPCVNGQCTRPDSCTCMDGYQRNATSPNICYKECAGACEHGTCNRHGYCVCDRGHELLNDTCVQIEPVDCSKCASNCSDDACWCDDGTPCFLSPAQVPAEITTSASLAGLEMTWMMGAAVGFLLIVFVLVVMLRIGKKRQQYGSKPSPDDGPLGSVVYTVPDTLIHRHIPEENEDDQQDRFYEEVTLDGLKSEEGTTERLLKGTVDERL